MSSSVITITFLGFILFSFFSFCAEIKSSVKSELKFRLDVESRWAVHTESDKRVSINHHDIIVTQEFRRENIFAIFTGKSLVEVGPSQNTNYSETYAREQTTEFQLRDTYLQYKKDPWNYKVGFQQVVWGETFGTFFADIVNPKDLRDPAPVDLQRVRLPMFLALAEYLISDGSIQLIYSPQPKYNKIASTSGDFSPFTNLETILATNVQVETDNPEPFNGTKSEAGLRLSKLLGNTDLSVFYFHYYDRTPTYKLSTTLFPTRTATLTPEHQNITTFGLTLTHDFSFILLRLEALETPTRYFNGFINSEFTTARATQNISVIELGFPTIEFFRTTLQYSSDAIGYEKSNFPIEESMMSRRNRINTLSLNLGKTFSNDVAFDFIISNIEYDNSKILRTKITVPLHSRLEINLGYDSFIGEKTSYYGQYSDATRVWSGFHGYL